MYGCVRTQQDRRARQCHKKVNEDVRASSGQEYRSTYVQVNDVTVYDELVVTESE